MNKKRLPFSVNRNDSRSLLDQVSEGLRAAIVSGRYAPGDEIPSSRELCPLLGVSRIVTSAALSRLVDEGYLLTRTGLRPTVRDRAAKRWLGHVLFVHEKGDDNYIQTMLAGAMRDSLTEAGWLFSQAGVARNADGSPDFSRLDAALSRSVDLAMVMYHRPEINAHLARSKVPYAVFGEAQRPLESAVGSVLLDYGLAMPKFAASCRAAGVTEIVEVYWHRVMCSVSPELKAAGIRVRKARVPVDESEGRLVGVKRAGRLAFERMLRKGDIRAPGRVYFLTDDYLAEGALLALSCAGLKTPEDVRIATWANRGLGPDYRRPLSRMEMDPFAAGVTVASAIVEYLKTGTFPADVVVGPMWIDGQTISPRRRSALQRQTTTNQRTKK
jgi:DNA-binding transcriptional regulator YhcF (GntR family)